MPVMPIERIFMVLSEKNAILCDTFSKLTSENNNIFRKQVCKLKRNLT